ncbi:hypothetical protein DSUL_20100 [Desulfovibrionales bacterium]
MNNGIAIIDFVRNMTVGHRPVTPLLDHTGHRDAFINLLRWA